MMKALLRYDDTRLLRATRGIVGKGELLQLLSIDRGTVDNQSHHAIDDIQRTGIQFPCYAAVHTTCTCPRSIGSRMH
jgi:hypothetical protein